MTTALRSLVACAIAGAAALTASSCVAALGLDEEKKDAVDRFCNCPERSQVFASKAQCVTELSADLESATEPTRAAWMKNYQANCTVCKGEAAWLACLKVKPTCLKLGDTCNTGADYCCGTCNAEGKCGG